ncbi:high-affinity nickel-transport protein-domain-containing protein [Mortierella sp. GBAus27b]|nr:high-affinity nickel-transport protein-domain-containing protein [Mortierella sp. GBAus27b]
MIPASGQPEQQQQQQQHEGVNSEEEIKSSTNPNEQDNQQQQRRKPTPQGGLFVRLFRPLFNLIDRSWKMYPLGVLFGLGFDTATQVGVLGITTVSAHQQIPVGIILIFPALFTAGMSLIDTLDGILMANAYGWAFINPVRKLWYNLIVTLLGVLVAFVVGFAELFALLAEQLDLEGKFWDFFSMLANNFGIIGYVIIGLFVITWIIAMLVYHFGSFKTLEERVVVIQHTSMSSPSAPREEPDLEYGTLER